MILSFKKLAAVTLLCLMAQQPAEVAASKTKHHHQTKKTKHLRRSFEDDVVKPVHDHAKARAKREALSRSRREAMMLSQGKDGDRELRLNETVVEDSIPEGCEEEISKVEVPCPAPIPPDLPRKCAGVSAKSSGDPHFTTFDGLKHDCQGLGIFDMVKSLDSDFNLQGRFEPWKSDSEATMTTGVAFLTGDGEPKVEAYVPLEADNGCELLMIVGGDEFSSWDETNYGKAEGIRFKKAQRKKKGKNSIIAFYEKSEVQLTIEAKITRDGTRCVIKTELCIPDCYERRKETIVGLYGSPDGDKSNDWMDREGNPITPIKAKFKDEYAYCVPNWCVTDVKNSLFEFGDSTKGFDDYNHCNKTIPDTSDNACNPDDPDPKDENTKELIEICGLDGRQCLVDGCTGGEGAAKDYVETALNAVDMNCGTELFYEDFESDSGSEFGQIAAKEAKKNTEATKFLYFDGGMDPIEMEFDMKESFEVATVEFLFYEIDEWDWGNNRNKRDKFLVTVGDEEILLGKKFLKKNKANKEEEDIENEIYWHIRSITKQSKIGFEGNRKSQIHKVIFKIPSKHWKTNGKLSLKFEIHGAEEKKEAGGLDNIRILGFQKSCEISCDGTQVLAEDFDEVDETGWGVESTTLDNHTVLGPLYDGDDRLARTIDISNYATSAVLEFLLYEIDNADVRSESKFMVTIGGTTFSIGEFKDDEMPGNSTYGTAGEDSSIAFMRTVKSTESDVGFGEENDRVHSVTIDAGGDHVKDGLVFIGFEVNAEDKGAGFAIDDLRITVFPDKEKCEEVAQAAVESVGEGEDKCPSKSDLQDEEKCYEEASSIVCSPTTVPAGPTAAPTLEPTSDDRNLPTTPSPTGPDDEDTPSPTAPEAPTPSPTTPEDESPTKAPTFITGDPHIKKWDGETYDFHGECDLVLVENPDFNNGQGLYIHVRTKIQRWWSYIESAVVKIGNDTLEVKSGVEDRHYWVNGKEGHKFMTSRNLDFKIGGFGGRYRRLQEQVAQYKLYLPDDQMVILRSVKNMLRVELDNCNEKDFGNSHGLMGRFVDGAFIGRDRKTVMEDLNEFGKEWQVLPSDEQLFHTLEGPQYPEQCKMPVPVSETTRRLAASISRQDAQKACAHVAVSDFDNCVYDVMAIDDVDAALNY